MCASWCSRRFEGNMTAAVRKYPEHHFAIILVARYAFSGRRLARKHAEGHSPELHFELADKSRLMTTLHTINKRCGRGAMKMASAGLDGDRRAWSMKQERRTPAHTTKWADIPVARA